jgi:hypothetical protein
VSANPQFRDALSAGLDANTKMAFDFTAAMAAESGPAPATTPNGASDGQIMIGRQKATVSTPELSSTSAAGPTWLN